MRGIRYNRTPGGQTSGSGSDNNSNTGVSDKFNLGLGTQEQQERAADLKDHSADGNKHLQNAVERQRQDRTDVEQKVEEIEGTNNFGKAAEKLQEKYAEESVDRRREAAEAMLPDAQDIRTHRIQDFDAAIQRHKGIPAMQYTGHADNAEAVRTLAAITPGKSDDKALRKAYKHGAMDALSGDAIDTIASQSDPTRASSIAGTISADISGGLGGTGVGGDKKTANQLRSLASRYDAALTKDFLGEGLANQMKEKSDKINEEIKNAEDEECYPLPYGGKNPYLG